MQRVILSPQLALICAKLDLAEAMAVMSKMMIPDSRSWYVVEGSTYSGSVDSSHRTWVVVVEIGTDLQP